MPELCAHNRPVASCPEGCATHARDQRADVSRAIRAELVNVLSPVGPADTALVTQVFDRGVLRDRAYAKAETLRRILIDEVRAMGAAAVDAALAAGWQHGDDPSVLKLEVRLTRLSIPAKE